jgi:hypothetical protein
MSPQERTAIHTMNSSGLERTRYFSRQLITAADLTLDQDYFRERLRRHNRMLHGWGIVCGLEVTLPADAAAEPWQVIIQPGYALSPQGDEICVSQPVTIDLTQHCLDPVTLAGKNAEDAYLAIRWDERMTRPVRVHPAGCACADDGCEFSRFEENYEFRVLASQSDQLGTQLEKVGWIVGGSLPHFLPCHMDSDRQWSPRPCLPSSSDLWVVLVRIKSDKNSDDTPKKIEPGLLDMSVRRYVISLAGLHFTCTPDAGKLSMAQGTAATIMAFVRGTANSLVDLQDAADEMQPKATVLMRRADDTPIAMHAAFRVDPDETFATLVKREGDRKLFDPVENTAYYLRELYAMAPLDPEARVSNLLEALAPLEGLRLEVTRLRRDQSSLESLLDKRGVRRLGDDYAALPGAATSLPATEIRGLGPGSHLGRRLADKNIADIAGMSREDFVALAREGVAKRTVRSVERQAEAVWDRATEVDRIARAWRNQA